MDFTSLMQQAQKLASETQNNEDLPRVERSIPQILKATNEVIFFLIFLLFLKTRYLISSFFSFTVV